MKMTGILIVLLSVSCICLLVSIVCNVLLMDKNKKMQEKIKEQENNFEAEKFRMICRIQNLSYENHQLKEKTKKKVKSWYKNQSQWGYSCPNCGGGVRGGMFAKERDTNCPKCGCELDWKDVIGD